MKTEIIKYLPYLLSMISIIQVIFAGDKHKKSWLIGIGNQSLWLVWIIASQQWGFLPLNIALWIVYTRNHLKWNKQEDLNVAFVKNHPSNYLITEK